MEVINALGRRKSSVARVYMKEGKGEVTINKRPLNIYFSTDFQRNKVKQAFSATEMTDKFDVTVNVNGGGFTGQAEAIRLGIARALIKFDETLKPSLKAEKLTTRDSRVVERKKPGQKKARKRFQFSKR